MAITEYIVQIISDVTNPPGRPYTIVGVVIDAGTSRNLTEDGVTLEEVVRLCRSESDSLMEWMKEEWVVLH